MPEKTHLQASLESFIIFDIEKDNKKILNDQDSKLWAGMGGQDCGAGGTVPSATPGFVTDCGCHPNLYTACIAK